MGGLWIQISVFGGPPQVKRQEESYMIGREQKARNKPTTFTTMRPHKLLAR